MSNIMHVMHDPAIERGKITDVYTEMMAARQETSQDGSDLLISLHLFGVDWTQGNGKTR